MLTDGSSNIYSPVDDTVVVTAVGGGTTNGSVAVADDVAAATTPGTFPLVLVADLTVT